MENYKQIVNRYVNQWNNIVKNIESNSEHLLTIREFCRPKDELMIKIMQNGLPLYRASISLRQSEIDLIVAQNTCYSFLLREIFMQGINQEATRWQRGFYERKGDGTLIINSNNGL